MNDCINGGFELIGGLLYIINIVKLVKDKEVKGVSWIPTAFFTAWGAWNLYYYPSLNQWASFAGGVVIFLSNITWIGLVIYYALKKKIK